MMSFNSNVVSFKVSMMTSKAGRANPSIRLCLCIHTVRTSYSFPMQAVILPVSDFQRVAEERPRFSHGRNTLILTSRLATSCFEVINSSLNRNMPRSSAIAFGKARCLLKIILPFR